MNEMKAGDMAPEITLPAWPEGEVKLSELRGKYIVLYFYPRDNTPGCTTESCDFRDHHDDFETAETVVLGISRDSIKAHRRFSEKFDFPFRLLSDTDEETCTAYDVIKMKNMYG
ncbi:MAG: peroxiredoxin, partial [Mariprofundaceae bacterium]